MRSFRQEPLCIDFYRGLMSELIGKSIGVILWQDAALVCDKKQVRADRDDKP